MSSSSGARLELDPPRPRPSSTVGELSVVTFFDPKEGRVTHKWNNRTQRWDPT